MWKSADLTELLIFVSSQPRPLCVRMKLSPEFCKAAYLIYYFQFLCIVV